MHDINEAWMCNYTPLSYEEEATYPGRYIHCANISVLITWFQINHTMFMIDTVELNLIPGVR